MKKILFLEAASAALLLLLLATVIQLSACEKREHLLEVGAEKSGIRPSQELWVYAGDISSGASPLNNRSEACENIWSLCFSNIFLEAGEVSSVQTEHRENALFYYVEKKEKKTVITIGVHDSLKTAYGKAVTADDLLFNYYFRCDPSAEESASFSEGIEGGKEYYYGTKEIKKRKKKLQRLLEKPAKALKKLLLSELIIPELTLEYEWVEQIFSKEEYQEMRKGYQSAAEFFSHFYAYRTTEQPEEKSKETMISGIAGQYGADYHALEKVTGKNYQEQAERCALIFLLKNKKADTVKNISGIKKINEHMIQLSLPGAGGDLQKYLDFWLLPLENYGMSGGCWEKKNSVWKKGGAGAVYEQAEEKYTGSGSYYCGSMGEEKITFYKNRYAPGLKKEIGKINLICNHACTDREIVEKMLKETLDLAVFSYSEETERLIKEKKTSAIEKLAVFFPEEETDAGILYRTDYINATTFPKNCRSLRMAFYQMGSLEINE